MIQVRVPVVHLAKMPDEVQVPFEHERVVKVRDRQPALALVVAFDDPATDGEAGLRVMGVLDAAERSLQLDGSFVTLGGRG